MTILSPHAAAGKICLKNLPALLKQFMLQFVARLLALSPLLALFYGVTYELESKYRTGAAILLCIPLYLLLVLPLRFVSRGMLYRFANGEMTSHHGSYGARLSLGLNRLLRALPFLLPLLVYLSGFYYLWNIADATMLFRLIRNTGALVGGTFVHGTIILGALFVVAILLAFLGWRRHLALEFLPLSLTAGEAFKENKRLMKKQRKGLRRATLQNFLITLPAALTILVFLGYDLSSSLSGSLSRDLFTVLEAVTKMSFSANALMAVFFAWTLLYLPFVLFRKAALAVIIARGNA